MDRLIIERKLDSLQRCLQRIEDKCPESAPALQDDLDLQDIVVLNLSRAIQLSVDIAAHCLSNQPVAPPNTMGETFDRLAEAGLIERSLANNLKRSVGFRNIAVHNYTTLDMAIVHSLATEHLQDFRAFGKVVAGILDR